MNSSPNSHNKQESYREIRFVASDHFVPLLQQLGCSLLLSTYHAGRVVVLGVHQNQLVCEFHSFELAMGLALHPSQLAVGTRHDVVLLQSEPELAGRRDVADLDRPALE